MPFTAQQKREQRAQTALQEGKTYRAHHVKKIQPKLVVHARPKALPQIEAAFTKPTEEMLYTSINRAGMEAEDLRSQMVRLSKASETLQIFYQNWYKAGQIVDLKPIVKKLLGHEPNEHYVRFRLVKQNPEGLWRLEATKGPNKGKHLYIDLPEELFC